MKDNQFTKTGTATRTEAGRLPIAVNYHLNRNCNFRCKGCYATFNDNPTMTGSMMPREQMFDIVEAVAAESIPLGFHARKLTFAGGEPTLCPWLPDLIDHANNRGLITMLVTNATRLTSEYLQRLRHGLHWLTLSVDSLDGQTNLRIGRHDSQLRCLSSTSQIYNLHTRQQRKRHWWPDRFHRFAQTGGGVNGTDVVEAGIKTRLIPSLVTSL